jgi:hypothetical protein
MNDDCGISIFTSESGVSINELSTVSTIDSVDNLSSFISGIIISGVSIPFFFHQYL